MLMTLNPAPSNNPETIPTTVQLKKAGSRLVDISGNTSLADMVRIGRPTLPQFYHPM